MSELREQIKELDSAKQRVWRQIGLEQLSKMHPTQEEISMAVSLCILEDLPVESLNVAQYISRFRDTGIIHKLDVKKAKALDKLYTECEHACLKELASTLNAMRCECCSTTCKPSSLSDLADKL